MSSILMFIIATIVVGFTSARIANRVFPYQPLQSLLSFLSLFLVIVTVLQLVMGITGFLTPIGLLGSTISFSIGEFLQSRSRAVSVRKSQKEPIVMLNSPFFILNSPMQTTFDGVLDAIDSFSISNQETLITVVKKRISDRRRHEIAINIQQAQIEYQSGQLSQGSVEEAIAELET